MSRKDKIVVAVDGPAGSGKSSVCKKVAIDLSIKYIDSGAIYRAITWYLMHNYADFRELPDPVSKLDGVNIKQIFEKDGNARTFVNDKDVTFLIREEGIAQNISYFSDNGRIREFVNILLRKWAGESSIIMDGRDIGTVVFPDADLKIYLDASVEVRTSRRVKEYSELGKNVDENSIRNQIILRDSKDKNRIVAPLKKADGAFCIDTSDMKYNDVVEKLKELICNVNDLEK